MKGIINNKTLYSIPEFNYIQDMHFNAKLSVNISTFLINDKP